MRYTLGIFALVLVSTGAAAQDTLTGSSIYAASFLCGPSDETKQEGVGRGVYATMVQIYNPSSEPVAIAKRFVRALPFQSTADTSDTIEDSVPAGASLSVECDEIRGALELPLVEQYRVGTLLIAADAPLEVDVTYTARPHGGDVSAVDRLRLTAEPMPCVPTIDDSGCVAQWDPFDPGRDWPPGGPEGPPVMTPEECLPGLELSFDEDGNLLDVVERAPGDGCIDEPRYCREVDGQFTEVSLEEASQNSCEGFVTTVCQPLFGGTLPIACGSAPPLAECTAITVCPDENDIGGASAADQTADPSFPALQPLPPPTGPTPGTDLGTDGTRLIWPCVWDSVQARADSAFDIATNAANYSQFSPVPAEPYNFVGLSLGEDCQLDRDCLSGTCGFQDELDAQQICLPGEAADNPFDWGFQKGNDRWFIRGRGGLTDAHLRLQGLYYPSIGYSARAGAEYRIDYRADGLARELFEVRARVDLRNCSWSRDFDLQIDDQSESFDGIVLGAGGNFVEVGGLGSDSGATAPALRAQCEAALQTLRDEEEATNQAFWDALIAADLHNRYGPAGDRSITSRADASAILAAYRDRVQDGYLPALAAYEAVQPQASENAWVQSIIELDIGYSRAAQRIEHNIGPFRIGVELDVVGKIGFEATAKSKTDWTAPDAAPVIEPEIAAGVQVTPRAGLWTYMSLYSGLDILIATVTAGIQGEFLLVGVELPTIADFGLDRAVVPIDPGGFPANIPIPGSPLALPTPAGLAGQPALVPPTGAQWRGTWGYNIAGDGAWLDGRIKAFLRARFVFVTRQWNKTLVSWEGLRSRFFSITPSLPDCGAAVQPGNQCGAIPATGCCLPDGRGLSCGNGGTVEVSDPLGATCGGRMFDASGTVIAGTLPGFGMTGLPLGEQRNGPFFAAMPDTLLTNPSPNPVPFDDLGEEFNDNIDDPERWELLGFCGTIVP